MRGLVLGLMLLAMGVTGILDAPSASATHASRPRVVADCFHKSSVEFKPTRMVVACGGDAVFVLKHISYRQWSSRKAIAHATQRYNGCTPDCADGHLVSSNVTVRLFRPTTHDDRRLFACLVLSGGTGSSYTLLNQPRASACKVHGHTEG
jgi:hypothetical protein